MSSEQNPTAPNLDLDDLCLYVIWSNGRHCDQSILADLAARFEVLAVHEIVWSAPKAKLNFERFYSDIPVRGVYHALNKGIASFLAIVVRDPTPRLEQRNTSRGVRQINGQFLDAKLQYRDWAGEFTVHSTETNSELVRDLWMLMGQPVTDFARGAVRWDGVVQSIQRDLMGSNGWSSAAEFFRTLNYGVDYVVPEICDEPGELVLAKTPNVLTSDYHALAKVIGLSARETPTYGGCITVSIANQSRSLNLRYVGDQYFCRPWAEALLAGRRSSNQGIYIVNDSDRLPAAAYCAIARSPKLTQAGLAELQGLEQQCDASSPAVFEPFDTEQINSQLQRYMEAHDYSHEPPLDPRAAHDKHLNTTPQSLLNHVRAIRRRFFGVGAEFLLRIFRSSRYAIRDSLVSMTVLRRLIKRLKAG